jgi:hypothetical protein
MKHLICGNMLGALSFFALLNAAEKLEIPEVLYELNCTVKDQTSAAVEGATIRIYRRVIDQLEPFPLSKPVLVDLSPTNAEGKTSTSFGAITSPEALGIHKAGYYSTRLSLDWRRPDSRDLKIPYTTELHAMLKPIKNPIPMHASSNLGSKKIHVEIPRLDQAYGFDLKRCEPLPPLGKGEVADFHFKVTGFYRTRHDYDCRIEISFLNPGDGLVEFYTPLRWNMSEPNYLGSELQSDYEAPSEGYQSTTTRADRLGPDTPFVQGFQDRRNFYFRCRTKKDASGKIISAHYGKIYGDIKFLAGDPAMGCVGQFNWTSSYFNPTPNDRNVEFDTKRNLNPDFEVSWP